MAQPGAPVERDVEYGYFTTDDIARDHRQRPKTISEIIQWCKERGLPHEFTPLDDIEPERLVYHSPEFFENGRLEGSWALVESVRKGLREPYPMAKLPRVYDIQPRDGKGLGVIATCNIRPGQAIMCEHPVVMITRVLSRAMITSWDDTYQRIVDRLESPTKEQFLSLKNCKTPEEAGPIEGIVRTNAFRAMLSGGTIKDWNEQAAVALDMSRVNHSCSPNAGYAWDEQTYSFLLYAIRPIARGEEIYISYIEETEPRDVRQKRLKLMYKFDCKCIGCDLPDEISIRRSDERRKLIQNYDETKIFDVVGWVSTPNNRILSPETFLAPWLQYIDACDEERLRPDFCAIQNVSTAWCALGNLEQYRKWADRMQDALRIRARLTRSEEDLRQLAHWTATKKNPRVLALWGCKAFLTRKS